MATKTVVRVVMALLMLFSTISVQAAESSSISGLSSFQPFRSFNTGEGEGYARTYKPRTKEDFVQLLRSPETARSELRVSCEILVRQLNELHPELAFEGCQGAAAAIENNPDFEVVDCEGMQRLAVTNADGNAFGEHVRACYAGEKILRYKDVDIMSLTCLNPTVRLQVRITRGNTPVRRLQERALPFANASTHSCPLADGARYLAFRNYVPEAMESQCVRRFAMPRDGHLGAPPKDGNLRQTAYGDYNNSFSTQCGRELHENYQLGAKVIELKVFAVADSTSTEVEIIFEGTLQGDRLIGADENSKSLVESDGQALLIPDHIDDSMYIAADYQGGIAAPTVSGNGHEFGKFRRVDHATDTCPAMTFSSVETR